jgi:hypothetical protein
MTNRHICHHSKILYIAKYWEKFDADGDLMDGPTREQLRELVAALLSRVQYPVAVQDGSNA